MKKIILASLLLISASTSCAFDFARLKQYCKDQLCEKNLTYTEQVEEAIRCGNVKQVLKLVKADNTTPGELAHYIKVANQHFGLAPEAKLIAKGIGIIKVALGAAILYKAVDHFRDKWGIYNSDNNPSFPGFGELGKSLRNRWFTNGKSTAHLHNMIIDIAAFAGVLSAKGGLDRAFSYIQPKCEVKDHLLIQLYLNDLARALNAS